MDPETAIPEGAVTGVLLGPGGRVDHDTLPGPGRADEDRAALWPGDDPQRVRLLACELAADPFGELVAGDRARGLADVAAGVLG